jgi:hypothetical protein
MSKSRRSADTVVKNIKIRPSTYAILQHYCPKKYSYADFLHKIITDELGTKIPVDDEEVMKTK